MNIFCLHENPVLAAMMMCDQHIKSKMIVESAQMIANCFSLEQLKNAPLTKNGEVRKYSYFNHPCSKWVRETRGNMQWLLFHAAGIDAEKHMRGYTNPHHSMKFIVWAMNNIHIAQYNDPTKDITDFAIAINENSNCRKIPDFENLNAIEKYRLYYKHDKPFATYTNTNPPEFMDHLSFDEDNNIWRV